MQPVTPNSSESLIFLGKEFSITLPSGRLVVIRETNGEDDELISNLGGAESGDNIFNFLANITLKDSYLGYKPLVADIVNWPVSDRYYLLFKQRIINRGNDLKFPFICQNPNCKYHTQNTVVEYEQNLEEFDGDLSDPAYKSSSGNRVVKYPLGNVMEVELVTSSQKQLKYKILTGLLEKKQLEVPMDSTNKNSKLKFRELSIFQNGKWELLSNFRAFSSREMSEIRANVIENDPLFDPMVNFVCQLCKTPYRLPLLAMPAFYWPGELT